MRSTAAANAGAAGGKHRFLFHSRPGAAGLLRVFLCPVKAMGEEERDRKVPYFTLYIGAATPVFIAPDRISTSTRNRNGAAR